MHIHFITLLVLMCLMPAALVAQEPNVASYRLERQDVMSIEDAVVVRLIVTAPGEAKVDKSTLNFHWRDKTGHRVSVGNRKKAGELRRFEIVFVAQTTHGTDTRPPMFIFSTSQKSNTGEAPTSNGYELDAYKKVKQLLSLDVKSGEYPIGELRTIGTLDGDPIRFGLQEDTK